MSTLDAFIYAGSLSLAVGLFHLISILIKDGFDLDNGHNRFAWLPKYVYIWDKSYEEKCFIWLRRYTEVERDPQFYSLNQCVDEILVHKGFKYVISRWGRR